MFTHKCKFVFYDILFTFVSFYFLQYFHWIRLLASYVILNTWQIVVGVYSIHLYRALIAFKPNLQVSKGVIDLIWDMSQSVLMESLKIDLYWNMSKRVYWRFFKVDTYWELPIMGLLVSQRPINRLAGWEGVESKFSDRLLFIPNWAEQKKYGNISPEIFWSIYIMPVQHPFENTPTRSNVTWKSESTLN